VKIPEGGHLAQELLPLQHGFEESEEKRPFLGRRPPDGGPPARAQQKQTMQFVARTERQQGEIAREPVAPARQSQLGQAVQPPVEESGHKARLCDEAGQIGARRRPVRARTQQNRGGPVLAHDVETELRAPQETPQGVYRWLHCAARD